MTEFLRVAGLFDFGCPGSWELEDDDWASDGVGLGVDGVGLEVDGVGLEVDGGGSASWVENEEVSDPCYTKLYHWSK